MSSATGTFVSLIPNLRQAGTSMSKLPLSYYQQSDVVSLAKDLIGKKICSTSEDILTSGIITETEAYSGHNDKACHAHLNKKTQRTEIMFAEGGHAYVYLCYGIHNLFNIVTNQSGNADAILVRAIEPLEGISTMLERRKHAKVTKTLTAGPGNFSKAMGLDRSHYGQDLVGDRVWIEEYQNPTEREITASTRIGVDYAGEDALLPWRFYLNTSRFVSKR